MNLNEDKIIQPNEENTLVAPRPGESILKEATDVRPSFKRAISNFVYGAALLAKNSLVEVKSASNYLFFDRLRGRRIKERLKNLSLFNRKEKETYYKFSEAEYLEEIDQAMEKGMKMGFEGAFDYLSKKGQPSQWSQMVTDPQPKVAKAEKAPLVLEATKPAIEAVVNASDEVPLDIFENRSFSIEKTVELLTSYENLYNLDPARSNHLKPFISALKTEKALLSLNDQDIEKGLYEAKFDSESLQNESLKPALRQTLVGDSPSVNQRIYKTQVDVALADMNKYYFAIENETDPQMREFWADRLDSYMEKNKEPLSEVLTKENLRVTGSSLDEKLENIEKTSKFLKQYDNKQQNLHQYKEAGDLKSAIFEQRALDRLQDSPIFKAEPSVSKENSKENSKKVSNEQDLSTNSVHTNDKANDSQNQKSSQLEF